MSYRVVVLASGAGTLLQALIDAIGAGRLPGVGVAAVIADREAAALDRARAARIPTETVVLGDDRAAWDRDLRDAVASYRPDLVVSAGFMKLVGADFLDRFAGSMINTHPSLLPAFPGRHAVRDAVRHGVRVTGATIFFVDAGVDTGQIIAQEPVAVTAGEDVDAVHERIKVVERELLINVVRRLAEEGIHGGG